jgi:hypothetical protein
MTDKDKAPEEPQGSKRRKRAAPTIDLTATEVPRPEEAAPAASAEPPAEPEQAEPEASPASEQTAPPHRGFSDIFTGVAVSFIGAVIAIAVLAALWATGALPVGQDRSADIAALQKQVQDLQNRAAAPAPAADSKAVEALRQIVVKLENDIAKLPRGDASTAARLTAIDNAMNALGVSIGKLGKRGEEIAAKANDAQASAAKAEKAVGDLRDSVQHAAKAAAPSADPAKLDALQQQVSALEQSLKSTRDRIAVTSAADKPARLALGALSLRAAVVSGRPYRGALAQAKALGADDKALAPLTPFAATGLPSKTALAQELRALLPALLKASGAQKAPSGFLERLQANADKLVHFSSINAPQGDAPADVLARLEVEAARDDIAGALADLAKLPAAARQPAQQWMVKVKAREAALAAAGGFAASAARALGQTGK